MQEQCETVKDNEICTMAPLYTVHTGRVSWYASATQKMTATAKTRSTDSATATAAFALSMSLPWNGMFGTTTYNSFGLVDYSLGYLFAIAAGSLFSFNRKKGTCFNDVLLWILRHASLASKFFVLLCVCAQKFFLHRFTTIVKIDKHNPRQRMNIPQENKKILFRFCNK